MDDALINKTMDRDDLSRPACRRVLSELFGLMRRMNGAGSARPSRTGLAAPRSMPASGLEHPNHTSTGAVGHSSIHKKSQTTVAVPVSSAPASEGDARQRAIALTDSRVTAGHQPDSSAMHGANDSGMTADLTYSSWYGRLSGWPGAWEHINRGMAYQPFPGNPDELKVPWFLLWEIAWLVANTPLRPGSRVLDMGGAGSLFSCFLAARGHEVVSIDIDADLCRRADALGAAMNWRMHGEVMDMAQLDFPDAHFDHIFSVCVFEHLPVSGRVRCNEHIRRVLKPKGTASYTFDYANPQAFGRLATPEDVNWQFVEPSGLAWRGRPQFEDSGKRYLSCPQSFGFGRFTESAAKVHAFVTGSMERSQVLSDDTDYTFGALFLEKLDG